MDAGTRDVGVDAGARDVPTIDVGVDSGARDVPVADVGFDAGPRDTGTPDTGTPDAGRPDVGTPDVGTPDAGRPDTGTPDVPPACVPTTEMANGRDDDCDGLVDEGFSGNPVPFSLSCTGSGPIFFYGDGEVDDGGSTRNGDGLEVFCFNGIARFCLTNETCPWRAGPPAVDDGRSCSSAGLSATPRFGYPYFMAFLTETYLRVDGTLVDLFYCPLDGRVIFGRY